MKIQASSVTDIVYQVKQSLESQFRAVVVQGEISNLSGSAAGHWYFTLSDGQSSISCALFKMDAYRNPIIKKIKNGDQVLITGPISVYTRKGTFQLLVKKIHNAGKGNLLAQYEALKEKLKIEGLFDLDTKKEIPKFPSRVAVITALKGAALQDFLNVMKRRILWGKIIIVPAIVQGDDSAKSLSLALKKAQKIDDLDVIVLTRGGGAIEDLWSFNDEHLVRQIYNCKIPVISAIGHQVDYTLCDFVADLRCETPTAAAEILSQGQTVLKQRLSYSVHKLKHYLFEQQAYIDKKIQNLNPLNLLHLVKEKIHLNKQRLNQYKLTHRVHELINLNQMQMRLDENLSVLENVTLQKLDNGQNRLKIAQSMLKSLNPNNVLKRGYAIIKNDNNKVITNVGEFNTIKVNQSLAIQFNDGTVKVKK